MTNKKLFSLKHLQMIAVVGVFLLSACKKDKENNIVVITASGDITAKVNEFRQVLGAQLNTTPGVTGGRREINWDGVPDSLVGKPLPVDFFNSIDVNAPAARKRGLVYASSGEFRVSKTNFVEINSSAANQFGVFSGDKNFANISTNAWDVFPQVSGTSIAATVKGFGIVFSDVDVANSTFIEFFNGSQSLGKYFAPVRTASSSFSFLGVYFKTEKVTRIHVGHDGNLSTGGNDVTNGGTKDLVVLDDFLYDEPVKQ